MTHYCWVLKVGYNMCIYLIYIVGYMCIFNICVYSTLYVSSFYLFLGLWVGREGRL